MEYIVAAVHFLKNLIKTKIGGIPNIYNAMRAQEFFVAHSLKYALNGGVFIQVSYK